jgi:hypothetical protein
MLHFSDFIIGDNCRGGHYLMLHFSDFIIGDNCRGGHYLMLHFSDGQNPVHYTTLNTVTSRWVIRFTLQLQAR